MHLLMYTLEQLADSDILKVCSVKSSYLMHISHLQHSILHEPTEFAAV